MRMDRRKRAQELASEIQASQAQEANSIKELMLLQIEEAKTSMVSAMGEEILRKQGEVQGLIKLFDMLTRKPIPTREL